MAALPVTAEASEDPEDGESLDGILIPIPVVTTPEPAADRPEPAPLTPDGNLSLVDDVYETTIRDTLAEAKKQAAKQNAQRSKVKEKVNEAGL